MSVTNDDNESRGADSAIDESLGLNKIILVFCSLILKKFGAILSLMSLRHYRTPHFFMEHISGNYLHKNLQIVMKGSWKKKKKIAKHFRQVHIKTAGKPESHR